MAIFNQYKSPVWTISSGRNVDCGTARPATPGKMILDLRRMNRILNVDPALCMVLLEPGVTFQLLNDCTVENDIPLWARYLTPGFIASLLGSALEREVSYNWHEEM